MFWSFLLTSAHLPGQSVHSLSAQTELCSLNLAGTFFTQPCIWDNGREELLSGVYFGFKQMLCLEQADVIICGSMLLQARPLMRTPDGNTNWYARELPSLLFKPSRDLISSQIRELSGTVRLGSNLLAGTTHPFSSSGLGIGIESTTFSQRRW